VSSPEIAEIILDIVKIGVLRTRGAAWAGDSARCAIAADHIHNLPDLLRDYSAQLLQSREVWRTSFTSQLPAEELAAFQSPWNKLRRHVAQVFNPALVP
jgi:hypothetical protein